MCGLAGIVALHAGAEPPSRSALLRMAAALEHRGPDEFGLYRDGRAGLAHARLSIIDLASGQQPMSDETERTWIVFNGEIFNYLELRDELAALGHSFRTRSDTEVIVQAYRAWGDAAFERLQALARPRRHLPTALLRASGTPLLRERGESDLRC